jgi:hypothetical protein
MHWTEYGRLQIHTSVQFSYDTNRVRLAGVVPLLQGCFAPDMLIYRGLSASCIGRSDRLVNSGLSGLSGRSTARGHEVFRRSQGSFFSARILTGGGERCIQKSRSKRNACTIRTSTGLLHVAYLKEGMFSGCISFYSLELTRLSPVSCVIVEFEKQKSDEKRPPLWSSWSEFPATDPEVPGSIPKIF